jgi:predicted GNAT family N-acyltransferase
MTTVKKDHFTVSWASWQQAEQALRAIREQVFIHEQHVPEALEWDGLDEDCKHILVRDSSGQAIATARLQSDGHIGRMAVLPQWRHRGIGSAMLRKLVDYCSQHGLQAHLHAQTHALGFYRKMGFTPIGEEFLDAGIPHRNMIITE